MSYGGGYNNGAGGYTNNSNSSYAGRSAAARSPTSAKKHMLKLIILGDSGYVICLLDRDQLLCPLFYWVPSSQLLCLCLYDEYFCAGFDHDLILH